MKYFLLLSFLLVLIGCTNDQNPNENEATNKIVIPSFSPKPSNEIVQPVEVETEVEDVTFNDFIVPSEFLLKRELSHFDTDASYFLFEYEVSNSIHEINDWIRSESTRLGGKIIERYSYDIESKLNMDLIIELPSKVGTRIISTYTPQYMDKKHLVIEETLIKNFVTIDQNYEDHALVIFTPMDDGTSKESFKGNYFHQHTDIFSVYFYTQAFFQELIEINKYDLDLRYDMTKDELDYLVGYFDKEGNEFDMYSITDENRNDLTFGIQLKKDFLPNDENQRERLLFNWAKTVLLGDKARSEVHKGSAQLNFLLAGKVFKSFTLSELLE
jgi:hypothetical protein